MKLVQPFLNKGYSVYMDNFYSSPALFEELLSKKTFAVGTLRTNRNNFPLSLKPCKGEPKGLEVSALMHTIIDHGVWD